MELSFVIKALQRRWWVVVLFSLLGAIPGSLITADEASFESIALLFVSPPSSDGGITFVNDPDRYVQSQLTVLESLELAEQVAVATGAASAAEVNSTTEFRQITDTDIVAITTSDDDPEQARLVAQTYVDLYLDGQREQVRAQQQPDIDRLDERLFSLRAQLDDVNAEIEEAVRIPLTLGENVPDANLLVPGALTQQELLVSDIGTVQAQKNQIELAPIRSNTDVVQNAITPLAATQSSNSLFIIGGYILGAMLGVVIALMWAQFSPYLIDELSVTEVTGHPVVGSLGRTRTLRTNPLVAAQQGRSRSTQTLGQLAVRAEALGSVSRPLVILNIGPRAGAGATTTALALAGRFAQQGSVVTMLDADDRERTLSERHPADPDGGLGELVRCVEADEPCSADRILTPTELSGVNVIAQGDEISNLRRANAESVLRTAALFGDVLIVDGGPLLGSAAVIEACRHADAIVLAIPLNKQLRQQLEDVVQQLGADRNKLLTVVNEPVNETFFSRILDRV